MGVGDGHTRGPVHWHTDREGTRELGDTAPRNDLLLLLSGEGSHRPDRGGEVIDNPFGHRNSPVGEEIYRGIRLCSRRGGGYNRGGVHGDRNHQPEADRGDVESESEHDRGWECRVESNRNDVLVMCRRLTMGRTYIGDTGDTLALKLAVVELLNCCSQILGGLKLDKTANQ